MNAPTNAANAKLTINVTLVNNPCFNDEESMGALDLREEIWCATTTAAWTSVHGTASDVSGVNCYLYPSGEACICQDDGYDVNVEASLRIALVASVLAATAAA